MEGLAKGMADGLDPAGLKGCAPLADVFDVMENASGWRPEADPL